MNSGVYLVLASMIGMISLVECRKCPELPSFANLDIQKLTGHWYSIWESSAPRLPCLNYNVTIKDGNLALTFFPYGLDVTSTPVDPTDITKGSKVYSAVPFLNNAHWSIFATDYDTYAGNFVCNENPLTPYYSVTFWSRTTTLSAGAKACLQDFLDKFNVDHSTLELMEQRASECSPLGKLVQGTKAALLKMF